MNIRQEATVFFILLYSASASGQCFKEVDAMPTPQRLLSDMDAFFKASNRFSIRMLQTLNNSSEDSFFSPFSVWSSMILIYLGSRGTTEREFQAILGLQGVDKNQVAHSYQSLKFWFTSRMRMSAHTSFAMANNLFLQKDVKVRSCLLRFLDDHLGYVDFAQSPELARVAINYWVHRETRNKISEILPPFSVNSLTQFVVTSTMYFRGAWLQQFQIRATRPRPFYVSHANYVLVDTMVTRDTFLYAVSDELQCAALEMPYLGRSLTMVVMLPKNKVHGVQILIRSLTEARLDALAEDMFPTEIRVAMPKFHLERTYQLSPMLSKMGLRDLSRGALNLTGFTEGESLSDINALFHKTYIVVDERGTEAAAATATALSRSSRPTRVVDFIVDRPFLFYIRENHSNSVLFVGVVRNPKTTKTNR